MMFVFYQAIILSQINPCGKYYCKMYMYNASSVLTYVCDGGVTIFYDTLSQGLLLSDSCCAGGFSNNTILFNYNDSTLTDGWSCGYTCGKLFPGDSISCFQKQGSGPYNYYFGHKLYSLPNGVREIRGTEKNILVYPNPASDKVNVELKKKGTQLKQISIIDMYGKSQEKELNNNNEIDVSSFAEGLYFICITTDKGIEIRKIAIQR